MIRNPELQRNFWLDFTLQRSLLTPIIVSMMVYITHLTGGSPSRMAFNLMLFFIFLWGIKTASETVIEEINENTWDFQRQSALSPYSMTFGKLFGSTLFSWYGAAIAAFYYVIFSEDNALHLLQSFLILMGGGLLGQSLALLASLQIVPQIRRQHAQKTFRYFLFGLCVSGMMTLSTLNNQNNYSPINWFQFSFSAEHFLLVSLWLFTLWAFVGLQRSFSAELQYQHAPIAWLGFNIFALLYFSGLSKNYFDFSQLIQTLPSSEFLTIRDLDLFLDKIPLYTAFFVAQLLTYVILISDPLNTIRYKKILLRLNAGDILEASQSLPLWIISFLLMFGTGIFSIFYFSSLSSEITKSFSPTILISTLFLLTTRDILLFHYFSFNTNIQRVIGAFVIYMLLLYFLIPGLLSALNLGALNVIFLPSWGDHSILAFTAIFTQIGALVFLCTRATAAKTIVVA